MTTISRLLLCVPMLLLAACMTPEMVVERRLERSYEVAPGSSVRVELSGGSVTTETGPARTVKVLLRQDVTTHGGDRAADELLASYEISVAQQGGEVRLIARRRRVLDWNFWRDGRVRLNATLTVPADVRLDLGTSGGSITARGDRTAPIEADTSGGSITIDGGRGDMRLATSGGSIKVGRALGALHAGTSGGSISVTYVGSSSRDVDLNTSGGSIRVGVDPRAAFTVSAGTSGGSVRVEDLPFESESQGRSHANGTINGGGGRLRASTSGGGVTLRAADDPSRSANQRATNLGPQPRTPDLERRD